MYGDFILLENSGGSEAFSRVRVGDNLERNEAWLRDVLFAHPGTLPISAIDATFGPLIPLCREMRTEAGFVDAVFINAQGRLTIVECKLWRNPQARREVIGQILDYVSAISAWGYGDLQRQVSAAYGRPGNVPFEAVNARHGGAVRESEFIDSVSRSLREGRILALIVGDGIREEVQRLSDTINRGANKAFSLGLIEVALYELGGQNGLLIQPRVLAKTEVITRQVTIITTDGPSGTARSQIVDDGGPQETLDEMSGKQHLKEWWTPVLSMRFDDPEQEPPYWVGTNNVVLSTPFPGILIKSYASVRQSTMEVFVSGRRRSDTQAIAEFIKREAPALLRELPPGTDIQPGEAWPIRTRETEIENDDERRSWIMSVLNAYANALRPRLRKWSDETLRA